MTRDCWDEFALSGKVSDYLKYKEQEYDGEKQPDMAMLVNGVAHGTDDRSDRHGAVGNACR